MKRARATMEARKRLVKCGSQSRRRRQPSSGAASLRPISSSSTCGGGSTWTCRARHKATRTAVLSGAAVCISFMNLSHRDSIFLLLFSLFLAQFFLLFNPFLFFLDGGVGCFTRLLFLFL